MKTSLIGAKIVDVRTDSTGNIVGLMMYTEDGTYCTVDTVKNSWRKQ